jgi:prevent-host-death family protein
MAKHVSAAEAKAHFSALVAEVLHSGTQVIIERHGRPVAALVGIHDLERIVNAEKPRSPRGALALVGAWTDAEDDEIDRIVAEIYAQREHDVSRPVDLTG